MNSKAVNSPEITVEKLLTLAYVGIFKLDLKTREMLWTPSFAKILGLKRSVEGEKLQSFLKRINIKDREKLISDFRETVKGGEDFTFVFRVNLPNGKLHWIQISGLINRDNKGKALSIEGLGINITKSKILERELKRTINQLKVVFASVPVGITVEVDSGLVMYTNAEMVKLLNMKSPDDIVGRKIKNVLKKYRIMDLNGNRINADRLPASEVFGGKKKVARIYSFEDMESGTVKWLKITATAVDPDNAPTEMVVKVFQNITKEQEQQQNTFASLGIASHELKNALASVKAYIQLVKRKLIKGDLETARHFTDTLDVQTLRLIKLINDLLDVSRIQSDILKLSPKKFNYSELAEGMAVDYKQSHPDRKFSIKIEPDIEVVADQDRIIQVIVNILSNAFKYSQKGSRIGFSVYREQGTVVTRIRDEGIGIKSEDKFRIFELFKRGEGSEVKNTSGLGIGLYTSNAIIKAHGGSIMLKSRKGKGSTFFIRLPLK